MNYNCVPGHIIIYPTDEITATMTEETSDSSASAVKEFDFEQALEKLEEIVTSLEDGELSLEESLQAFEKGIKLTRNCQGALKSAEQKIQLLLNEDGDVEDITDGSD